MPTKKIVRANDECEYCFTCLNQPGGKSQHFEGCAVASYSAHRRMHGPGYKELNLDNMLEVERERGPNWKQQLQLTETKFHPRKRCGIHYFSFPTPAFPPPADAVEAAELEAALASSLEKEEIIDSGSDGDYDSDSDSDSDGDYDSDSDSDSDTERTTAPAPQQSNEEGLREAMLRAMPAAQKVEMFRLMSDEEQEKMVRAIPVEQAREMFALMP